MLWIRGYPDQAAARARDALDEAHTLDHSITLCFALAVAICPTALRIGDLIAAEASVTMLLELSVKHGLSAWNAMGRCLQGALLIEQGDASGLVVLEAALDWLSEAKFALHYANFLGIFAKGLAVAGRVAEASKAIDEALDRSDRNTEHWCLPELLRIKGEILRLDLTKSKDAAAEGYFLQALEWSRRQGALSWELRAALSLAGLWHLNGKTAQAAKLLSAVYDRFTEGFETADLRTARSVLDEFRMQSS